MKKLLQFVSVLFVLSNNTAIAQCSATITPLGLPTGCGNRTLTASHIGDVWTQKTSMNSNRTNAAGFSIGTKGYVGTGSTTGNTYTNDFWEYDATTDAWTQKMNFPGTARSAAVGFSIGNKGYIGTGVDLNGTRKADFYQYDPATNTWLTRTSMSMGRSFSTGFSIGTKGYVGTGYVSINYVSDFWEYNPTTDTWLQRTSLPATGRHSATGFSIGSKGYIGFGSIGTAGTNDFYEFDPVGNAWTPKASIFGLQLFGACGFGLGNKGYMACGKNQGFSTNFSDKTYQFDPVTNKWKLVATNPPNSKNYAVAFTIGGKGYVTTGSATSVLYEYEPEADYLWSTGATTPSISAGGTASYSVLITTAAGCTTSATQSIATAPNPTLSVTGNSLICAATNNTLSVNGATSYTWSANAGGSNNTQAVVAPTISTTYIVSGTTGSCTVAYPVPVFVSALPVGNISVNGPTVGCGVRNLSVNPGGDTWTQKASMTRGRERAISFSIGSKGYMGAGNDNGLINAKDFWEYDPIANVWTQKADFGGGGRYDPYSFSIGSKGYAGGGNTGGVYDGQIDFWEYDPLINLWTRKADIPMIPRFVGVSFAIGNKGYAGMGMDGYGNFMYHDFWEYDPVTDFWLQKADLPSTGGGGLVGFGIGNKGYLGTGYATSPLTLPLTDFWEFNPLTNSWTPMTPFPGGSGNNGIGFTIGDKGYITSSNYYSVNPAGLWEYNSVTNTWAARTDFPGPLRTYAAAFVVGNKAYMGTGRNGSSLTNYKDLWQYEPAASFVWSTGATASSIVAPSSGSYSVTINTVTGCSATVTQSLLLSPNPTITVSGNANNICASLSATLSASGASSYTWSGNAGGGNATTVIVTPGTSTTYTISGTTGTCTVDFPVPVSILPTPSASIAVSGPTLGCGVLTLSVYAPPMGWTQKAGMGSFRRQGVSFSIGGKGYVGLGQSNVVTLSDFWEYDPQSDTWTQKASFTPGPRYEATGFSINTKGYVACGYNTTSTLKNDFWEFDPVANSWTQKLSLNDARAGATGFGLNGKGYIGLGDGNTGSLMDFWEYDPANNTWTQKANYSGGARTYAASFTIGSKGYVGTGYSNSGATADFREFDPVLNTWTLKTPYGGGAIINTRGFSINNKGYFVAGSGITNAMWEYDAGLNSWTQKPGLTGGARTEHVAFAIGNKGYAGVGFNPNISFFSDLWEFEPGSTLLWSTGSTLQAIPVTTSGNYSVSIINAYGCSASASQPIALSPNPTITVSGIPTALCSGASATLAASGANSYTWSGNAGGGNTSSVIVSPGVATIYSVSGTSGTCTVNYPVNINVSALPVASIAISGPTIGCGTRNLGVTIPQASWTQKMSLNMGRSEGVAFSIGAKGYVGLGENTSYLDDFWEYDPANDSWTQKASFTGGARICAIAFSIGSKGYVTTGYTPVIGSQYKNDLWQFDPLANSWMQKNSLPGAARYYGTGFALNGKGYAGLGTSSTGLVLNDFWEYDPAGDSWVQKNNFSGGQRTAATAFTIGSLAYVGTGFGTSFYINDLWAFDPVANSWTAKANPIGPPVQMASAFSLGNKGYLGLGYTGTTELNVFYEYNAASNTWAPKASLPGLARKSAVAFAIGNKGYIATGYNTPSSPFFRNDLWEYQEPTAINWSTGSTQQVISVTASGNYSVTLTNGDGCSASSSQSVALSPNPNISVSGYTSTQCSGNTNTLMASGAGSYTWSANAGGGNSTSVIVTPSVSTMYTVSATSGSCTVDYPVYVGIIAVPAAGIIPIGSTTVCGAAVTLSSNPVTSNAWAQKTGMSTTRSYAAGFSLNGKGYIGTGLANGTSVNDFWEFDPVTNSWSQKSNFAGGVRYGATGLSIGNKGYIGTGLDGTSGLHKNDFWEYNPVTNTWTQKANFGGTVRRQATAFTIGNKGYIGIGWDGLSYKSDFWEYDPATDLWTAKASMGVARFGSVGLSLGTKGYVAGGQLSSGGGTNQFWEFDPALNFWTQRTNITGTSSRISASGFTIGNRLIISGGSNATDVREYDPVTDSWALRTTFPGLYRTNAVSFSINGKGYIISGSGASVYNDIWEYSPLTTLQWSTGATTSAISVTSGGTYTLAITGAGCSSSTTQAVSITPIPTVNINGSSSICNGSTLTFTANGAASYSWSANAGNATTNTVTISPTANTSYSVIGATNGCTASAVKAVTVNAMPVVTANTTTNSICQGFSIILNGGGATSYTWTGGAINNTPFAPNATTDYTVTGSANNCTNTAIVSISVMSSPTVTVNSGAICTGQSFTMTPNGAISYTYSNGTNVVTPGTTTSYSITGTNAIGCTNAVPAISTVTVNQLPVINVSNSVVCIGSSYTITPTGAGSYTYTSGSNVVSPVNTSTYGVTGTSTAGCVSAAQTVFTLTVSSLPTISVSGGTVCNGQSFTLMPTGAASYTFLPGGGSAIVSPNANISYSVSGANSAGCVSASMAIANLTVLVSPTISVNSGSICAGQSFTLNPTGAPNYTYSGGSAIVSPASTSVYTVTGFNANGCPNAALTTATLTVHALPVITANSGVMCAGSTYTIVPSGASSYSYSGGSNSVSPAVTSTYAIAGTSSVGCVSSASTIITVTVSNLPLVSVSSGSICDGNSFNINPSGAVSYTVSPGGLTVVSPNTTTSYSVIGINADGCLSAAPAISSVTVYSRPLVTVNSGSICAGASFTFNPAGASTYTYSGGSAIVSPNTSSTYSVTGMSPNGCISATPAIGSVTVYALPVISANSATICNGQNYIIVPTGAASYAYSSGTATVTPAALTQYTVNGSSIQGCHAIPAVVTVSVQPSLIISISGPTTVCQGQSLTLTVSGANSYLWSNGVNSSSISVSPVSGTTYSVNAVSGFCSALATHPVSVTPVPPLETVSSHSILCVGETGSIVASGADTYVWSDGSTFSVLMLTPTVTTTYTLTGINVSGCNSSTVITQEVSECLGINNSGTTQSYKIRVYPNPNNGFITVEAAELSQQATLELYNYLGQLISSEPFTGTETQLHFENAANGMYTLRINAHGKPVFVTRLIKQ